MELNQIKKALPHHFNFYHFGEILLDEEKSSDLLKDHELEEIFSIGFQVYLEDQKILLLTLFNKGLDESTYTEIGNIIAGQTASNLSQDAMVSPPFPLSSHRLKTLLKHYETDFSQSYYHHYQNNMIPIQLLVWKREFTIQGDA